MLLGVLLGLGSAAGPCLGQDSRVAGDGIWLPLKQAIQAGKQSGRLVLVITSSRGVPESTRLTANLKDVVAQAESELNLLFAEMPAETYSAELKRMGVSVHPTLILYRVGSKGIQLVHSRGDVRSVRQAAEWLDAMGVLRSRTAEVPPRTRHGAELATSPEHVAQEASRAPIDPQVDRTAGEYPYGSQQTPYPSEQTYRQQPPPPIKTPPYVPPAAPPVQAPPQQTYQPVYQQPPVVTGQVSTPVVVSPPQVPVVVQPQAPTIIVGPTPQPNIIFAAAPPSVPTFSYITQGNAPQPTANAPTGNAPQLFMANAPQPTGNAPQPVAMAPQPQPVAMAPQPQPVAMAPQPQPQPVAMAPQPTGNAPQVGQSPALLAAVLTNPSLINRLLGAFGDHLAQRRNPRIQMGQAPQMMPAPAGNAPTGSAPGAGLALAPAGYAPTPGMTGYIAVPAPAQASPPPAYGYAYGPPPGQGYGPGPGYYPPNQGYPPQPPPDYYQPQGPPPVGPSPQSNGASGGWHHHHNYPPPQPSAPGKQSVLNRLLGQ